MKSDWTQTTTQTTTQTNHENGHGNDGGTMSMRTMNTASDTFGPREAGSNDAAGKRAVAIQALILSRRLRVRARLARRAALGRDTGRLGIAQPDAWQPDASWTGAAVPNAGHADAPGTGR